MIYDPKNLKLVIKFYAIIAAMYADFRAMMYINMFTDFPLPVSILIGVFVGLFIYSFAQNVWTVHGTVVHTYVMVLFISDILFVWTQDFWGNEILTEIWLAGGFAFILMVALLCYGFYNERIVVKHSIAISNSKLHSDYKIAVISDLHFGTIQPERVFINCIDTLNKENYDAVFLVGDIVERGTSHDSFIRLFESFCRLKTKYGIYFVYGNHDRQEKAKVRTFTDKEFKEWMKKANITCVDDKVIDITDDLQIIGRKDYSYENRMDVHEIIKKSNPKKLRIALEHQPVDYEIYSENGMEVALSAHTHGAQNWPVLIVYALCKMKYNGLYRINDMLLHVNAGFAGSRYGFRTHAHCEYLSLELHPEKD